MESKESPGQGRSLSVFRSKMVALTEVEL